MEHFGIFLTNNKGKTVELPVAPSELKQELEVATDTQQVSKIGDVTVIGMRKPLELTVKVRIPLDLSSVGYVTAKELMSSDGEVYLDWLKSWLGSKETGRFVVVGVGLSFPCYLTKMTSELVNGDASEYQVELTVKEWRNYTIQRLKDLPKPRPKKKLTVGSRVIVNGRLHYDSYGSAPGLTEKNAERTVSHIVRGRRFPIHVTLHNGGYRGWVTESSITRIL